MGFATLLIAVAAAAYWAGWSRGRRRGYSLGVKIGRAEKRREQYRAQTRFPFVEDGGEIPGLQYMVDHLDEGPPYPTD